MKNNVLEILKDINNKKLAEFSAAGDSAKKRKQEIIAEFFNEPMQFLNMPIEMAYSMLTDLGIEKENLAEFYRQLIS